VYSSSRTKCCIAGGWPAGVMLQYFLVINCGLQAAGELDHDFIEYGQPERRSSG
jgi:hypothetical protein